MSEYLSFSCTSRFYGDEYFPFGLDRSGEFTIKQATLLLDHGKAYQALQNGGRDPVNAEEKAFVEVCRGLRKPVTRHEIAWMKFCEITQQQNTVSAFGSITSASGCNNQNEDYSSFG